MADLDKIMTALRNAHAAGDTAAAKRLAAMAKAASAAPVSAPVTGKDGMTTAERIAAAKAGTLAQPSPERLAAAGAADEAALAGMQPTPSVVGDLLKAAPSAFSRGVTGLLDLPGAAMEGYSNLVTGGLERTGLVSPEFAAEMKQGMTATMPTGGADTYRTAAAALSGGASEYQPQTTAGEYLGTVAEFLPGAMAGGLPGMAGRALAYGVIPGLASEGAGQLTEGTAIEPYARAAAALGASFLAGRPGAFQGDDEAARMANVSREAGVRGITTGQAKGSQPLMRMEGRLQATDDQLADFTAATMSKLGSKAKVATPDKLMAVEKQIVGQMDDAVRGVDITPTSTHATTAARVAADYAERVPAGNLTPRVKGIAKEIAALAKSGKTVALERIKTWRSDIGGLTVSPDAATREAAHNLRKLLDDMTDAALTAAGRTNDIAKLAAGRESYRNYIGVRDAASRAGAEGGILSPQALNQSMIRAMGREAYATGRTTPMVDFTRSAAATLRPAPAVSAGGVRSIGEALPAALATLGAGAGYGAGFGPLGMAASGLAGALAPSVGQMAMRSGPVQSLLRDPANAMTNIGRAIPGLLAQ
jgi:hypothetical protein